MKNVKVSAKENGLTRQAAGMFFGKLDVNCPKCNGLNPLDLSGIGNIYHKRAGVTCMGCDTKFTYEIVDDL